MNADNPVQIDLLGASATGTKDTRLAEHIGGSGVVASGPGRGCDVRYWPGVEWRSEAGIMRP
jgi:hypothetical protein